MRHFVCEWTKKKKDLVIDWMRDSMSFVPELQKTGEKKKTTLLSFVVNANDVWTHLIWKHKKFIIITDISINSVMLRESFNDSLIAHSLIPLDVGVTIFISESIT